jgi:Alpha-glutamyl/putrescinyl thymine pyrophosphorylase clade 2
VTDTKALGRFSELHNIPEVSNLELGMDFRLPQYRREVFLRFYEFHLKYRSHPGAIYYMLPYFRKKYSLTPEQSLWMGFLNGNTQNIVTTQLLFRRFPSLENLDIDSLSKFFNDNWARLSWDTDRRYQKKDFIEAVKCYRKLVDGFGKGSQLEYFSQTFGESDTPEDRFVKVWDEVRKRFLSFGRLATFSYLEYLRIQRLPIDCNQLFLEDMSGSKSHRNGLAKVLGRDDLDCHKDLTFDGKYGPGQIDWLAKEATILLDEARVRMTKYSKDIQRDVSFFTLESCFCTFKSWHRKNRRYANVYNDMFHDRIKLAEKNWPDENFDEFWTAREESLPIHLLLEKNPNDPGLRPEKQNYYRDTGSVIMMSKDWPEFDNPFDRKIWS